jgi:hypothetical protein
LDEIQATPHALEALRYFFEERPELPVVAAGSLLEFALSREAFSMPVGRVQYLFILNSAVEKTRMAIVTPLPELVGRYFRVLVG